MSARARLVRLEGDEEVATIPLADEIVIGRDPAETDVVIDHPVVSRRHLRVIADGDGHSVEDLGSSNGTWLNGRALTGSAPLDPGDTIVLGGAVTLVYEQTRGRGVAVAIAAVVLVLALGGGAGAWFFLRGPPADPIWDEATRMANEAVAANQRGEATLAKRQLTEAFDLLWSNGKLDDVPHGPQARAEGLTRLGARLGGNVDLNKLYRGALEASRPKVAAAPTGACRLDSAPPDELEACVRQRAEQVLLEVWQEPKQVPERFYDAVRAQVAFLLVNFNVPRALERGEPWMDMMREELEAEHIPSILRYLPMIESAYKSEAVSPKAAGGMWQFMPATAKQYGLAVGNGVDERTDPRKATRAAAKYLNDLAFEFGGDALLLAIAAYNKGENGVRASLKKLRNPRTERSYWTLVDNDLLPDETRDYVPRFVAAAVLGEAGIPPQGALR